MGNGQISTLKERYRSALLARKMEKASDIKAQLIAAGMAEDDAFFKEEKFWLEAAQALMKKAELFAESGAARDSFEFQDLLSSSVELGSCVKAFLCQAYDKKVQELQNAETGGAGEAPADVFGGLQLSPDDFNHWGTQKSGADRVKIDQWRKEIRKYRTWRGDPDKMRELEHLIAEIRKLDPEEADAARKEFDAGKTIEKMFKQAFTLGISGREAGLQDLRNKAREAGATELDLQRLDQQFQIGSEKNTAIQNAPPVVIPSPPFGKDAPLPYLLSNLKPSRFWRIMVDETGEIFDRTIFDPEIKKREKGKFVAVAIPEENTLPRIDYFHATDSSTADIVKTLSDLLLTEKPCGIIGVTLESMLDLPVNYWYNGLERLFDLIYRLLPLDDEPTKLEFMIEGRGTVTDLAVQRAADACLYRFAKAYPEKAEKIKVEARVFAKKTTQDRDFRAYNGYADSLACAWNGGRQELNELLNRFRLRSICLLEGEVQNLYEIMDNAEQGIPMPGPVWNELLTSPDAKNPDSVISRVLKQLGDQVRSDLKLWQVYLTSILAHLDSKAIEIRLLGRQISWLKENMPPDAELPPRLKLTWLTAELAHGNHTGATFMEYEKEFMELVRDLYEEDAPLTCWAVLNLAVQKTNAYEFTAAQELLRQYARISFPRSPADQLPGPGAERAPALTEAAIPGLRYYGQLLSSCGQHEAFLGDNAKAVVYFQKAIGCFERLSERREADISHTMAYYATAQMDLEPTGETSRRIMERYLGENLEHAAERLARSDSPKEKYQHHILLRYLVRQPRECDAVKGYLSQSPCWKTGQGHPWEMVEFYRGVLSADPGERMARWRDAHRLCRGFDATLHVIDAVILGSILAEDPSVLPEYEQLVEQCAREIPALGDRLRILREQGTGPLAPLELAEKILPFNFR